MDGGCSRHRKYTIVGIIIRSLHRRAWIGHDYNKTTRALSVTVLIVVVLIFLIAPGGD